MLYVLCYIIKVYTFLPLPQVVVSVYSSIVCSFQNLRGRSPCLPICMVAEEGGEGKPAGVQWQAGRQAAWHGQAVRWGGAANVCRQAVRFEPVVFPPLFPSSLVIVYSHCHHLPTPQTRIILVPQGKGARGQGVLAMASITCRQG